MESPRAPEITVETIWRTILITDARNSSKAYFSERADEALVRIERDRALFGRIAAEHEGEEVRDRGDGSMFAFCDPIAAIRASMAMQKEIARLNEALPEGMLRLVHRMGVHMGPIKLATTFRPGSGTAQLKMSGDIVVVAARLEAIGHPGEVCFSNDVYKAIRSQIDHEFRYLDATLKGFDRPMRCWSTRIDPTWARPLTAEEEEVRARQRDERRYRERWEREQRERRRQRTILRLSAVGAAVAVGVATVVFLKVDSSNPGKDHAGMVASRNAGLGLPLSTEFATDEPAPSAKKRRRPASKPSDPIAYSAPDFEAPKATLSKAAHKADSVGGRGAASASREEVRDALRDSLASGDMEGVPGRLARMRLSGGRFDTAVAASERFQQARDWLASRLAAAADGPEGGLTLDPPVAGFALLTGAGDQGLGGMDVSGVNRQVSYLDLSPDDFARLLRAAATDGDPAPDPDDAARSLAALRGGGGS